MQETAGGPGARSQTGAKGIAQAHGHGVMHAMPVAHIPRKPCCCWLASPRLACLVPQCLAS
ncbi:hypothetical protein U9M48_021960 [Paspalum notatum var. saurae]|uniref:Uncharacterized protein n=1 Tax=Paspalum notatum var. saurae TaxID=547442 RepID=A0AAQ3WT90_PASNO